MLEKRIRLIELKRFDRQGAALIRNVLERSDSGSGNIVDLRMYMGGNFESFVEITKLLVNRQVAVTLQTRDGGSPFIAGSPDSAMAGQCVYIINGSTILYGELLAHLLKNAGARLVGQRTTGFTPRLNQVELGNGDSVLITEGVFNIEGQSTLGSGVDPSFHMETDNSALLYAKCIALMLEKG